MENEKTDVPLFVSIITALLGCYDVLRGVMHTFAVEHSALYIAKLNLATPQGADLIRLMGALGISNFITGFLLILVAFQARGIALSMLLIIPIAYGLGMFTITLGSIHYPPSVAAWGGTLPMLIYLSICLLTFISGLIGYLYNKSSHAYL